MEAHEHEGLNAEIEHLKDSDIEQWAATRPVAGGSAAQFIMISN